MESQSDTEKIPAYVALPESGEGPGVVVLHAWWGLNDFFKGLCDRLAQEGFVAVAPDLYDGAVATTSDDRFHRTAPPVLRTAVARRT